MAKPPITAVVSERKCYYDDASRDVVEVKWSVKEEDECCNKEVSVVKPVYAGDDLLKLFAESRWSLFDARRDGVEIRNTRDLLSIVWNCVDSSVVWLSNAVHSP